MYNISSSFHFSANFLDSMIEKARDDTPCNCSTYYCQDLQVGGVKIGIVLVEKMASTEEENGEKPK